MSSTTTARLFAVPALAATLALAGCGGDASPSASSPAPSSSSSSTSSPSASAGSAVAKATTPQAFVDALEAAAAKQDTVAMTISGDVLDGSGVARLGADPAGSYVVNVGDSNTLLVLLDGVVYAKDGSDSKARWSKGPAKGVGMGEGFTPLPTLKAMRGGAKKVVSKGAADLQGTPTTKYELTVDAKAAAAVLGADASPGAADPVYTVWVDGKDLLRRVSVTAEGQTLVIDYGQWGEPVEVVAPPADQVDPAAKG